VICARCGTSNPPGLKFCEECGSRLSVTCPACGSSVSPTAKFCGECGNPVAPGTATAGQAVASAARPSAAPSDAGPVAERRLVSVLFADLVGFTPFAEERDAEEVRETLTRYFERARDVIGRYGGSVEKFIGDAVMAVWGAPTAHEDDAERAVRAGLELVDAVRSLGPGIEARAGVVTGEAAVTVGAVGEGLVAGDLVNTAARLQGVAPSGSVLVGEATQRAASRAIAFEPAGEQVLKGKAAPVAAWRALRVVAERGGRNRSEGFEAPFVGRQDELRLLKDLFHATEREGRARLVSVIGPAGIGKSRLAWELSKYLDGISGTVWWHHGRSPAYGDGITFWALGEMVRGRCGLAEGDDEGTTRARVRETLTTYVPDEVERAWIEPALLSLLGIGASTSPEQLFAAWRTFFERLSATAPVVLIFEDFHFADTGLLDFVDHVMEWSRDHPIYVLALSRPELLDRRPDWGAAKRNFTSLHLEPLPNEAMLELLAGLVPGLPEPVARAIVARADGIPLYAVETVRMLLDEGRLESRDGVYAPVGDLTILAIPETLTALIASRLDGLEPTDRALVSDGAVLGQSFTIAALAAVSGIAEADLGPRLRGLVRREFLAVAADPRSPERGQYVFVQALIREVAYNTLARADRKRQHLAAARYFEALGSDELAGALAGHYLAAQANAPEGPERDALATQARLALEGAATRAAALGAHDQALTFLDQALMITADTATEAELRFRVGDSASNAGRYELAESSLRRALEIARASGDRSAMARAVAALGDCLIIARRTIDALALLGPASVELADLLPDPAVISLDGQLARAHFLAGDHRRAVAVADPVLEAAEHADLTRILADTLVTKGSALASLGRMREGVGVIEIGERVARDAGHAPTLLRALRNRAATIAFLADADSARRLAEDILALAIRLGDLDTVVDTQLTLGWCAVLFDADAERALDLWTGILEEDLEASDRLPIVSSLLLLRAWRGEPIAALLDEVDALAAPLSEPAFGMVPSSSRGWVAFSAGRHAEAQRDWDDFLGGVPTDGWLLLPFMAHAALWDGDADRAREYLERLVATGIHFPAVELCEQSVRAGLAALTGSTAEALVRYASVLDGFKRLGQTSHIAFTGIDMASLLDPSEPQVREAAARAREIFVSMGATPFIERLDRAMARSAARDDGAGTRGVVSSSSTAPTAAER
jgi:class 3 adenylate cyclase/tetratricopeptide (TPR) repeat protein